MRAGLVFLAVVGFVAVVPVAADIGTVTLELWSPWDGGVEDVDSAANGTVVLAKSGVFPVSLPVVVKVSVTTGGPQGVNSGLFAFFANLEGTALGDQTGRSMTIDPVFKRDMGVSVTTTYGGGAWAGPQGLGFNGLVDSGAGVAVGIHGFGASQTVVPGMENFQYLDAQYVGHPAGSHPLRPELGGLPMPPDFQWLGAVGPVTAFKGELLVNAPGTVNLNGAASLWNLGGGSVAAAHMIGDALRIERGNIDPPAPPEPGTMSLLGLGAAALVVRWRRIG